MKLRALVLMPVLLAACGTARRPSATDLKHVQPTPSSTVSLCERPLAKIVVIPRVSPSLKNANVADTWASTVDKVPEGANACFVANDNISSAMRESASAQGTAAPHQSKPPKYMDLVDQRLRLTREEHALLARDGFVVLDRFAYTSYGLAYHEIFRQQLPLFVSIDSILHATYMSNGTAIARTEEHVLSRTLYEALVKMNKSIVKSPYSQEVKQDLKTYLGSALKLLSGDADDDKNLSAIVRGVGLESVQIFGRDRMVDKTRFEPRGNYVGGWQTYPEMPPPKKNATDAAVEPKGPQVTSDNYFRALTWLSRLELNLVSRPCASSSPNGPHDPVEVTAREIRLAMAVADLAQRAGTREMVQKIDATYATFVGPREDVGVESMLALMKEANTNPNDPNGAKKIVTAVADRFPRRANTHFRHEACGEVPAVMTMFGIRAVPDVEPLTNLVHAHVAERKVTNFADIGYVLGHDAAAEWLVSKESVYPEPLNGSRAQIRKENNGKSLYNHWLGAVLALADHEEGTVPTFVNTLSYQRMRMNSALVGFGQIRHNYVAIAAQGYDQYGCEIPDGYVEPALGTIERLMAYQNEEAVLTSKGPEHEAVLSTLRGIIRTERAGLTLSEPQRRFLAMVSEYISVKQQGDSGGPPKYTGWYFDMFTDRHHGALKYAGFIGDYFTHTNGGGQVNYLGASGVRLGVFLVDTNGEPRVMVGPVAKGYFATSSLKEPRLNDAKAERAKTKEAPWQTYVALAMRAVDVPPETFKGCDGRSTEGAHSVRTGPNPLELQIDGKTVEVKEWRYQYQGSHLIEYRLGPLTMRYLAPTDTRFHNWTVHLLDHHGDAIGKPLSMPQGEVVAFQLEDFASRDAIEGVEFSFVDVATGERRFTREQSIQNPWVTGSDAPRNEGE